MSLSDLSDMTDAFKAAPLVQLDEMPEDGDFQAVIDSFDTFESKKGDTFIKTMMRVRHDKKYEGWQVWTLHNISDPEKMGWFKKHLSVIGADVEALEEDFGQLEKVLEATLDTPVEVTVKTSDRINESTGERYRNAYVNTRLGPPLSDGNPQGDLPVEEVELPKEDADFDPPF